MTDAKRLASNIFSLTLMQGFNYVLPLITLPYLMRILGAQMYGLIVVAQTVIQYIIIFTDYGFSLSATREVSINRNDKTKISEVFTNIFLIRITFMFLGFVILMVILAWLPHDKYGYKIFIWTFGGVLGDVLFPLWFYQGFEVMKFITVFNVLSQVFSAVLIFVFVKDPSDYINVAIINSMVSIIIGVASTLLVLVKFKVKFLFNLRHAISLIKDGFFFFLNKAFISLYTLSNTLIIASMFSLKEVAYYNLATKIVMIVRTPFDIVNTVTYPYVSFRKNIAFVKRIIKVSFCGAVLLYGLVYFTSPFLLRIFAGPGYSESISITRILSILIIFISVHVFLGTSTLVAFGYQSYFNKSVIYGSTFYLLTVAVLYVSHLLNMHSIAFATAMVDLLILVYRVFHVKRLGLLSMSSNLRGAAI